MFDVWFDELSNVNVSVPYTHTLILLIYNFKVLESVVEVLFRVVVKGGFWVLCCENFEIIPRNKSRKDLLFKPISWLILAPPFNILAFLDNDFLYFLGFLCFLDNNFLGFLDNYFLDFLDNDFLGFLDNDFLGFWNFLDNLLIIFIIVIIKK